MVGQQMYHRRLSTIDISNASLQTFSTDKDASRLFSNGNYPQRVCRCVRCRRRPFPDRVCDPSRLTISFHPHSLDHHLTGSLTLLQPRCISTCSFGFIYHVRHPTPVHAGDVNMACRKSKQRPNRTYGNMIDTCFSHQGQFANLQ